MENQTPPTEPREVKRADQLDRGDIVIDEFDDLEPLYREVRHVEPIPALGRVLIVFRGGETAAWPASEDVEVASDAEHAKHLAKIRAAEKRNRMRAGLMRLIEAIDAGMPLPDHFTIDGAILPDHEAVRRAAELLGADAKERDNGGRRLTEVKADFVPAREYHVPEVSIRMWHLGDEPFKAVAGGHTGTPDCCTYGCPAVES